MVALLLPATAGAGRPLQGKLDRSFGTDGRAFAALGNTFAHSGYSAMVRQPDGKVVLGGRTEVVKGLYNQTTGFAQRRNADGTVDASFGGGMIELPAVGALGLQADGKVLVGAVDQDSCGSSSTVRRLNPDGTPDRGFGKDGVSAAMPLAVQHLGIDASGRILVAGRASQNTCPHRVGPDNGVGLARLLADGSLDPGFGDGGLLKTRGARSLSSEEIRGLAVRDDGSSVVAEDHALRSFTAAGQPDNGFDQDGVVDLGSNSPRALVGLSGGGLALASYGADSCCSQPAHIVVSRYLAGGALDPAFGSGGTATVAVGAVDVPNALAETPDGSLVVGAETSAGECRGGECELSPFLVRLGPGGAPDPGFGAGGQAGLAWPPYRHVYDVKFPEYVQALAVAPSGQLLVAGRSGAEEEGTVSALASDGAPDSSFGTGGRVTERRELPSVVNATGLAIGPDGGILAAAWSNAGDHRSRQVLVGFGPDGASVPEVGAGAGFVASGTELGLRADGHGRFYSVSPASRFRGSGFVARFDGRGERDLSYGSEGRAPVPPRFEVKDLIVRRSGAALLIGRVAGRFGMAAYALTPQGQPVRRFGDDGLAIVSFGRKLKAIALAASFDRRGRVVLFGNQGPWAGLARLLPNGRPDPGFAYRGRQPFTPGLANERCAVAIAPGGGILVAAGPEPDISALPTTLIKYRPDGIRDRSFGRNGLVRVNAGGPMVSFFAGRRLLLVNGTDPFGDHGVAVRAFHADGSLDRGFGHNGRVTAATSKSDRFRPVAAARQPDGRLIVAGTTGRIEQSGSTVELLRFR